MSRVIRPADRGAERASATSLVYNRQTVRDCPRPGFLFRHRETGQLRPVPCGRNACLECGRRKAVTRALAAQWVGKPSRLVTLTLVGDRIEVIRDRVKKVHHELRGAGYPLESWWVVEANPRGTGHHVHALVRSGYIPQAVLSEIADYRGMGFRVDIRKLDREERGGAYLVKEVAAAYLVKGRERIDRFLAINGGRYGHHTRGFFGMPVREADKIAQGRQGGELAGSWELIRATEAVRVQGEGVAGVESIRRRYGLVEGP